MHDYSLEIHELFLSLLTGCLRTLLNPGVAGGPAGFPRLAPRGSPASGAQFPKPQLPIVRSQGQDPAPKFQAKVFEIPKLKFLS